MSQEERRTSSGRREQPRERTQREQRPRKKRKKGFNLMGTLLYVAFVIGVSTLLAAVGWVAANDLLALNKAEHSAIITLPDDIFTSREVTVETEDGTETETELVVDLDYVIDTLKENGIIEYGLLFRLYSIFSDAQVKMTPGTYQLDTDMDYRAIVTNLGSNSASRQQVTVTIPEGFTVAQIFQRLEDEGVSTVEKLNEMAATHDYAFSFLQDIPLGDPERLEGYLFPATYEFYTPHNPLYAINKMLQTFDAQFTDEMRQEVADSGRTIHEVLTVASMIEKETDGEDRGKIASVIYNRLNNPGASAGTNGYLQIDATLAYLNGGKVPTEADKSIDSPYNTYLYPGLPPGPIANPGLESIKAAMEPESTSYYYYTLGDDNKHHFFNTYGEMTSFMSTQALYSGG